jgi:hypothetical protein
MGFNLFNLTGSTGSGVTISQTQAFTNLLGIILGTAVSAFVAPYAGGDIMHSVIALAGAATTVAGTLGQMHVINSSNVQTIDAISQLSAQVANAAAATMQTKS